MRVVKGIEPFPEGRKSMPGAEVAGSRSFLTSAASGGHPPLDCDGQCLFGDAVEEAAGETEILDARSDHCRGLVVTFSMGRPPGGGRFVERALGRRCRALI